MSYPTLMVHVDARSNDESLVRLAARLASKFSSLLIGVSALAVREPFAAEGVMVAELTKAEMERLNATLAAKGTWFRKVARAEHTPLSWHSALEFPTYTLVREARSADLVIISQHRQPGDIYDSLDPAEVILRAGRPVLVVPDGIGSLRADHVVIGWKDTREARRAVQDALPFLHEATRVTIAEICETGEEAATQQNLDAVAHYLAHHRIKGGIKVMLHRQGSGAAQLIELALDQSADLLVTGAYGHSRLGEWIFGGVTGDLLAASPVCCFMSH